MLFPRHWMQQAYIIVSIIAILSENNLVMLVDGLQHANDMDNNDKVFFLTSNTNYHQFSSSNGNERYLIYDVNYGEGFNLRRDVYIRMATLVLYLNKQTIFNWTLVLPPWTQMYHWRSNFVHQDSMPWSSFFDIESLNRYIPVIEYQDYIAKANKVIDEIIYLRPYANPFEGGDFVEKTDETECNTNHGYQLVNQVYVGRFFGIEGIVANKLRCVYAQGRVTIMIPTLQNSTSRITLLDRAENVLHEAYGQLDYWNGRRSLVFAKQLREEGNRYRLQVFNSSDDYDNTRKKADWREYKPKRRRRRGGNYLAVHARRRDFVYGHKDDVLSLDGTIKCIEMAMKKTGLTKVFLATDAEESEVTYLKSKLPIYTYDASVQNIKQFGDGGIAIIDQWICAHAKYFIGTKDSTFSFRIYEERELMGFKANVTYNQLCSDQFNKCERATRWKVQY